MKWLITIGLLLLPANTSLGAGNLLDGLDADLVYNPQTGQVVLDGSDTPTGVIVSFSLTNPTRRMRPIPQEKLPLFPGAYSGCDCTPATLEFFDLTANGVPQIDLGEVFPPGMTLLDVSEFLGAARYTYLFALNNGELDIKGGDFDLVLVPEPRYGILAFLIIAILFTYSTFGHRCAPDVIVVNCMHHAVFGVRCLKCDG